MQIIFGILTALLGLYSLLIIIRIILTWFSGGEFGKPMEVLARITDPYLDWWRRRLNLRAGYLDLSPIVAMAALSVAQTICSAIAQTGRFTLGLLLAVCLSALWSAVSFLLGFCLVVLILRLIAYFINADMFGIFWRVIDSISRPLLYRVSRIIFGRRIIHFSTSIIITILVLTALWIGGKIVIQLVSRFLFRFPF
ncbi:MAG: YggT family protein [Treponema sp.]|nr:YggT family protein [Treponema sp.]